MWGEGKNGEGGVNEGGGFLRRDNGKGEKGGAGGRIGG